MRPELWLGLALTAIGAVYLANVGGIARRQGEWRGRVFGGWLGARKRDAGWYVKVERYFFGGLSLALGCYLVAVGMLR